jgi:hypothetical protein
MFTFHPEICIGSFFLYFTAIYKSFEGNHVIINNENNEYITEAHGRKSSTRPMLLFLFEI